MGKISAEIGVCGHPQGEELAVVIAGDLRLGDVVTALNIGHEAFAAVRRPAHRALNLLRGPDREGLLGMGENLHAEAAAHITGYDPELFLVDLQDVVGDRIADAVGALR